MKTLTKKQRQKIYLKVAEHLAAFGWNYLCTVLEGEGGCSSIDFTEFMLFEPTDKEMEGVCAWWYKIGNPKYNTDVRVICMLLCAEMCND